MSKCDTDIGLGTIMILNPTIIILWKYFTIVIQEQANTNAFSTEIPQFFVYKESLCNYWSNFVGGSRVLTLV